MTGIFDPPDEAEPSQSALKDMDLSFLDSLPRTARWYVHPDTYQRCLDEFAHAERVYAKHLKRIFKDFRPV